MVDSSNTALYKFKNQDDAQNDDKIPHKFTKLHNTIVTAIDKDLVNRFSIDEDTWAYQVADEIGIRLVFIKNRSGRPITTTKPDDQDYGE